MKLTQVHADKSGLRWLWRFCGLLAALYVVDFWAALAVPGLGLRKYDSVLLACCAAVVLSILAAVKDAKAWYEVTAAAGFTLLLTMYAASV
jgi:hypothetical protein